MPQTWPRRRFVRNVALVAGATALAPALLAACRDEAGQGGTGTTATPTGGPGTGRPTGEPNAYRLSSRHVRHPCNACLSHNRNRYYASADAAQADRAHPGCNCEVRGQVVADSDAASYFADGRTVFDARSA